MSNYSQYIEEEIISIYTEEAPFVSIFLDLSNNKIDQNNITEIISIFMNENKTHFKYLDLVYINFYRPNFDTLDLTKLPSRLIYNLEFSETQEYFDIISNDRVKIDRIFFNLKDSLSYKLMENTFFESLKIKNLKNFTISSQDICKINYSFLKKIENFFLKSRSKIIRGFFSIGKNIIIVNPSMNKGSINYYFGEKTDKYFQYPLIKFKTTYLPWYPSKFFSQHLEYYVTKYITE